MPEINLYGYVVSPELDIEHVKVVITPENWQQMGGFDEARELRFFMFERQYSLALSLIDTDALKSGETIRRWARRIDADL